MDERESGKKPEADLQSRLLANITHELKTPLHSILAAANLLHNQIDGPLNDEQRRQVEMILRNGEQLLEQITELLNYSSNASGTYRLIISEFDPRALFNGIFAVMAPVAARTSVTLETDFSSLGPKFSSDRALIQRIVSNLVSNALKFTPAGGKVSSHARSTSSGGIRFDVVDTGIGIPSEFQKAIFQDFFQVEAGDARRFGGVGLGLALVKTAVANLSGKIEVKSEPGKGSIFSVELPALVPPERDVLVAGRDAGLRLTLEECLRTQHLRGTFVETAKQLFEAVAQKQPELIIIDLFEADGQRESGFEILTAVRAAQWGKELPVIVMSALGGATERSKAFGAGASDFIVKPFDVAELVARINGQLQK